MTKSASITWLDYAKAYWPPIVWAGFIFVLSSQQVLPGFEVSVIDFLFKKSAHMIVYAILFLLLYQSALKTLKPDSKPAWLKYQTKLWLLPLTLALLYAIGDELHQTMVPGRFGTLRDVGYDLLGASLAFLKKYNYF